eukprot:SAG11_NODE_358_length_10235_cov_5.689917_6_plen_183_part_00
MSRDASQHVDGLGFLNYSGALQAGNDLKVENRTSVATAEAWCATNPSCEGITYNNNASETLRRVYFKTGITLNADKEWSSLIKKTHAPPGAETQQIWVKRLGPLGAAGGAPMAVLFVNAGPTNSSADFTVSLAELGITATGGAEVRDIWRRSDAPAIAAGGRLAVSGVAGHSSRFFRLSPRQ